MTKTLHIVSLPRRGGMEVMFLNFLKELKKMNPDLFENQVVFALNMTNELKDEIESLNVTFYDIQRQNHSKREVITQLMACVRKHEIDIVYGQNFTCNLLASIIGILKPSLKVISHEHGTIWKSDQLSKFLLTQFWIMFSDVIICNSEATKLYISERFTVKRGILKVILNGVPFVEIEDRKKAPTDHFKLLFIGRLWELKSVDTIILAIKEVKKEFASIQLDVLGDGPLLDELKRLAKATGVEGNVKFHGYVDNVDEYIREASLVVVPSIRESLGNVVIEAAFQEVPSIASQVDGLAEVIIDHETGRLIRPTVSVEDKDLPKYVVDLAGGRLTAPKKIEPNDLAQVILECLNDPEEMEAMGIRAKEHVTSQFSMERYIIQISELII